MLDGDAGNEAVDGAEDGYPRAATSEVDEGSFSIALDEVSGMVERLGAQILRGTVELLARGDALNDLLVDDARKPHRIAPVQYLRETPRGLAFPAS